MVILFVAVAIFLRLMKSQEAIFSSQRVSWELERERLLNRAMTKEWESYTQMSQAMMVASTSNSDPAEGKGMSDEEELRRYAQTYHETVGLGEVIVDMSDELEEL